MSERPNDKTTADKTAATDRKREAALARSTARLMAVQALYQMDMTGASWRSVMLEFETHRMGAEIDGQQLREADAALFRAILEGVVQHQVNIDHLVDASLVASWPLGRIDSTLRALFRCAGYELMQRLEIPPRVVINEYVDVAKAFFEVGQESKFTNAVLDHMARTVRAAEMNAPRPQKSKA